MIIRPDYGKDLVLEERRRLKQTQKIELIRQRATIAFAALLLGFIFLNILFS